MGFDVQPEHRTPWIVTLTEERGQIRYHVDRRTGERDSWLTVGPEDLALCQEMARRMLEDQGRARDTAGNLRAAISARLLPAGLWQELCGEECVEAGLVLRDGTGWDIPWHILFPHASLLLNEQMRLPERPGRRPSALFLLDPCGDLLYGAQADPHSVRVRKHMEADVKALLRLFDAAGVPVTACQGPSVTRDYITGNLGFHDFVYYLGHAREDGLLLDGGAVLSVEDLASTAGGRASCVFINGCRAGGMPDEGTGIARAIGRMGNSGCVVAPVYAVGYEAAGKAAVGFFGELLGGKGAAEAMEAMRRKAEGAGEGYLLFCNYPGMRFLPRNGAAQMARAALPALVAAAGLTLIPIVGGEEVPWRLFAALAACLPGALTASALYYHGGYYRCRQLPAPCLLLISLVLLLPGMAASMGYGGLRILLGLAYGGVLTAYTVLVAHLRLLVKKERMGI